MKPWRWLLWIGASSALLSAGCGRTSLLGGTDPDDSATPTGGVNNGGAPGNGGSVSASGAATTGGIAQAGTSGTGGASMSDPLVVLPATLPHARVRWSYTTSLHARGGAGAPFTFRLQSGALPSGVTLSRDGRLTGTPTRIDDFPFTVAVTDADGSTATGDYTLSVDPPRFLAHVTFVSTSSTRTSLRLTDITTLQTYTVLDEGGSDNAFSFDGRRLAFCRHTQNTNGELLFVDTTGTEPGPQQSLLEPGESAPCSAWVWSPDSHRVAYVQEGALWLTELDEGGVALRTKLLDGVLPQGLAWPRSQLLFVRDAQGRANALRLAADGSDGRVERTVVDAPQSTLLSASPQGDVALGVDATSYTLFDTSTGGREPLGVWPWWDVSPGFQLLLGRSGTGEFQMFRREGTQAIGLRSGTNATGPRFGVFASARPAIAQHEGDRVVVSELVGEDIVARVVDGAYAQPRSDAFDRDGSVLAFSDRDAIWLSDTAADGSLSASLASRFGPSASNAGPSFSMAKSTRQLIASGGAPYAVRLIDFGDLLRPRVSDLDVQLDWSESVWSPDDVRVTVLGASMQLGRALYLVDPARPLEPHVVTQCKSYGGGEPLCPNLVRFQP